MSYSWRDGAANSEADNGEQLFLAISEGLPDVVRRLIRQGVDVNRFNSFVHTARGYPPETTPLGIAVYNGDLPVVEALIGSGTCEVDGRTDRGFTPLHLAVTRGHHRIVSVLVAGGADVNATNDHGFGPLHVAVVRQMTQIALSLIEAGADPFQVVVPDGDSVLSIACLEGDVVIVDRIIGNPTCAATGHVNSGNRKGSTPCHQAALYGYPGIVRALVRANADVDVVNNVEYTPLMAAAQEGHADVARVLIESKANINHATSSGVTAIAIASNKGYIEFIRLLLKSGADVNSLPMAVQGAVQGGHADIVKLLADVDQSCVSCRNGDVYPLCFAASQGRADIVECLLTCGANVDGRDARCCTALFSAAFSGESIVVSRLLRRGAGINLANNDGCTPLMIAAQEGHVDVVRKLIRSGASVNLTTHKDDSAVSMACHKGRLEVWHELLDARVSITRETLNRSDTVGQTPCLYAAMSGNAELVFELISLGADVNKESDIGNTPLIAAAEYSHADTVRVLLGEGANVNWQNASGISALGIASSKGHVTVVKMLLTANVGTHVKIRAFYHAAQNGHMDIFKLLVKSLAYSKLLETDIGWYSLMEASSNGHERVTAVMLCDYDCRLSSLARSCCRAEMDAVIESLYKTANVNEAGDIGITPLHSAILVGRLPIVRELLTWGADANVRTQNFVGATPLHLAANGGNKEIVQVLLRHGSQINTRTSDRGETALHIAASRGHASVVEALVSSGADIDDKNFGGQTALCRAACEGHLEAAKVLLDQFASTDNDDKTPLVHAAEKGHAHVVKILAPKAPANELGEALYFAIKRGSLETVQVLLNFKVNLDYERRGLTPLHCACNEGHTLIVKTLIEHGAPVMFRDKLDRTALHLTVSEAKNAAEVAKILVECGSDVDAVDIRGSTPLLMAAGGANTALVLGLLNSGANANSSNDEGISPLIAASVIGALEVVKLLVRNGADMNATNNKNQTALQLAMNNGNISVINFLKTAIKYTRLPKLNDRLRVQGFTELHLAPNGKSVRDIFNAGGDVEAENASGSRPLHLAARHDCVDAVNELLVAGADISATDCEGNTPLHESSTNSAEVARVLIDQLRARGRCRMIDAQNTCGRSPLHIAVESQNADIVIVLLSSGASINLMDYWQNTPLHYITEKLVTHTSAANAIVKAIKSCPLVLRKSNFCGVTVLQMLETAWPMITILLTNKRLVYTRRSPVHQSTDLLGNSSLHRAVGVYGVSKLYPADENQLKAFDIFAHRKKHCRELHARNMFGQIPLQVSQNVWAIDQCLRYGGSRQLTVQDNRGHNFWHLLAYRPSELVREVLHVVSERVSSSSRWNGADQRDHFGRTPMHHAAVVNDYLVKVLIDVEAAKKTVDQQDSLGRTPLHYAAAHGHSHRVGKLTGRCGERSMRYNFGMSCPDVFSMTPSDYIDFHGRQIITNSDVGCKKTCFGISSKIMRNFRQFFRVAADNSDTTTKLLQLRVDDDEKAFVEKIWKASRSKYDGSDNVCAEENCEGEVAVFSVINRRVNKFIQDIVDEISRRDPRFGAYYLPAGSVFEKSKVDLCDEFDFMIVLDRLSHVCHVSTPPQLPPGYVTVITHDGAYADLTFDDAGVIDTRLVKFRFEVLLKTVLHDANFMQRNADLETLDYVDNHNVVYQFSPHNVGTCLTIRFTKPLDGGVFVFHDVSVDVVPALFIEGWWPGDARVPTPSTLNYFTRGVGCHFVFDQPQKKHPWVPWSTPHARVCFSQLESRSILGSPPVVRTSCVVVKQIVKNFSDFRLFKSYVVKSALMHCLADGQPDLGADLAHWVRAILGRILEFFLQDYVPSVFMPSFVLPVCIYERHVMFSHMRLHRRGLTFDDLASHPDFFDRYKAMLEDSQLLNIVRAYLVTHAMYWSVLPLNDIECRFRVSPVCPLSENTYRANSPVPPSVNRTVE